MRKFEAFKRAVQARKAQQVQKQHQKEEAIQLVAKYWDSIINNAKTIHDIFAIQQWMTTMEETVQQVHNMEDVVGPSKPLPNEEAYDSNEDGTTIEISSDSMFGIDDDKYDDV